ncbi:signal peptide peptidase SppA [Vagococcus elongatus]|uniref:Signal peptide peptidase SppA n=1 Tax=Vagococcus elongatus TaxID=180344 RepID=A0A430ARQ3_9ENTE|nr:signal peptide peptidase SppA [Vagococcus elongatus]RSU10739.1 signal peptide peptidase SppA [Vagococcus elongatus]
MNTKRWVAIAIAAAIVIFTISLPSRQTEKDKNLESLLSQNGLVENVLQEGSSRKIAKLTIDGTISSQSSGSIFSEAAYDHDFFIQALNEIYNDDNVSAVFLEVNSPGGGVYESAEIARLIKEIQTDRKLPLYVSMKNMAASGGYYVSASADKIFATEETMTGSIGVIMSGLNFAEMLDDLGVEDTTVKSGEMKDVGSSTRKWTDKDHEVLQSMINNSYDRFVNIVSEGRGMDEKVVREIADGRIYDGKQALENGLVDAIGFPEEALAALQEDHDLKDATVFEYELNTGYFSKNFPFLNVFTKQDIFQSKKATTQTELLQQIENPDTPQMMYLYGGE